MNKYTATITDDFLTNEYSDENNIFEWESEHNKSFKPDSKRKTFKTYQEAYDWLCAQNTDGSASIYDECCGELYDSTPHKNICKCCKREDWDRMESNTYEQQKKAPYHND